MRMRPTLTLLAALAALSACTLPEDPQVALAAPVSDPYVTGPNGAAVYQGDANRAGSGLPGTVPTIAPGADFASAGDTVYFGETEATLSDEARDTLARQAVWLSRNSEFSALVEGHADEAGTREFNLALGARRATSVREYLVSKGVDAGRIRTVSFGKERPAAICGSEASCLERNRRAVTRVSPAQAQAGV
ncbi:MAG: OmpA family protein [Paracoccus sp. (in: a-proteobacteria)]